MRHAVALKGSTIMRAVSLCLRHLMATPALYILVTAFVLGKTSGTAQAENEEGICTSIVVYTIRGSSSTPSGAVVNYESCHGHQCASSKEPEKLKKYCCSGWMKDDHSTELRCIKKKPTRGSATQAARTVEPRLNADDDPELVRKARNAKNDSDASKTDKPPVASPSSGSNFISINSPASGSNLTKQEKTQALATTAENTKQDTQQRTTKPYPTRGMTSSSRSAPQTNSGETKRPESAAKPTVDSSARVSQGTSVAETLATPNTQTESKAGKQNEKAEPQGAQIPPAVALDSPAADGRKEMEGKKSAISNHTPPSNTTTTEKSSDVAATPNVITLKPTVKEYDDGNDKGHLPGRDDTTEKSTTTIHTAGPAGEGATSGDTKTDSASQTKTDPLTLSEAELTHGQRVETIPADGRETKSTAIGSSAEPVSGQAAGGGAATESSVPDPDHAATTTSGPPGTTSTVPAATGQGTPSSIKQTATQTGSTQPVYDVHEAGGGHRSTVADDRNSTTHSPSSTAPTINATNCPGASNCSAAVSGQPAADSLSHKPQPAVKESSTASEVTISLLIVTAVVFVLALLWWWTRRRRRQYVGYFGQEPNLHFSNPVYDMEALMEQTSFVKLQDAAEAEDTDAEGRSRDGTPQSQ